jgi:peptidoglycan hydrolase-like protein with peptidoglycan-binding domain
MKVIEILSEAVDKDVMDLQRALKAQGADLGKYGPNNDGIDGRLGPYTRRAAEKFPNISSQFTATLAKPNSVDAQKLDVTTIQDPDFKAKLEKVAQALGVKSNDMMAVFKQESGINPQAVNPTSGATGLIQFMPATAQKLGTTTDQLKQMDGVQQLDYVYKYFKLTGVGDGTLGDLYMAVFMPKYIGYDDKFVLGQYGAAGFSGQVYAQNKGLDQERDGKITIADVKQSVSRFA